MSATKIYQPRIYQPKRVGLNGPVGSEAEGTPGPLGKRASQLLELLEDELLLDKDELLLDEDEERLLEVLDDELIIEELGIKELLLESWEGKELPLRAELLLGPEPLLKREL